MADKLRNIIADFRGFKILQCIPLSLAALLFCATTSPMVGNAAPRDLKGLMPACSKGPANDRIAACTQIIDATPPVSDADRAFAYQWRCQAKRIKENYDDAISDCAQAIKLDPRNDEAVYQRGLARRMRGDIDGAVEDISNAIKMGGKGPRLADQYYSRGLAYESKDNWSAAIADYEEALKIRPAEKLFLFRHGWALYRKQEFASAIKDMDAVIKIDPKFAPAFGVRGRSYFGLNDDSTALENVETALQLNPQLGMAKFYRGLIYEHRKDYEKAAADVDAAFEMFPDDIAVRTAHNRLQRYSKAAAVKTPSAAPAQRTVARSESEPESLFPAAPAPAPGRKLALVIGNSAYKFASPLPNPANDSTDFAAALRKIGFTVIEGHDLDWRGMISLVREFAGKLEDADVALFFYAGHGIQVNGENYLVPVDAKLETPGGLDLDAVDLRAILRPMEDKKRVNLVFLDACRDNPFTRSLSRSTGSTRSVAVAQGLAQVDSAAGTMIAYSTQPGNVAQDGKGRNSPFTAALLKYVGKPNLEVEQMMKLVRVDVMQATQQRQVPWGHSSLVGDVFLN